MTTYYRIDSTGCDDYTSVVLPLTTDELAVVERVAAAITAAGGGCQPTMTVVLEDAQ